MIRGQHFDAIANELNVQHAAEQFKKTQNDNGKLVGMPDLVNNKDFMRRLALMSVWHPQDFVREKAMRTLQKYYPGSSSTDGLDVMAYLARVGYTQLSAAPLDPESVNILNVQWAPDISLLPARKSYKPTDEERLARQNQNPTNVFNNVAISDDVEFFMNVKDSAKREEVLKALENRYSRENKGLNGGFEFNDVKMVIEVWENNKATENSVDQTYFEENVFDTIKI